MNQTVTKRIGRRIKDLCITCAYCYWDVSVEYDKHLLEHAGIHKIVNISLVKQCFNEMNKRRYLKSVLRPMFSCGYYVNSLLFEGFIPMHDYGDKLKEMREMPKISTRLAEANEPEEGKDYLIKKAEITTTDVRSYSGVRVTLHQVNKKGNVVKEDGNPVERVTMLWLRTVSGARSKIGSFMQAFMDFFAGSELEDEYDNTDNWEGHIVRFVKWSERNREIKVLK